MSIQEHQQFFQKIIEQHRNILFKVARTYCKAKEEQEDVVQEMMLQIWQSIDRYNPQYKISTWVYRIALNVAISHYRKTGYKKSITVELPIFYTETPENIPEHSDEQVNVLLGFIDQLKEIDKAMMLLYLEEKSYQEIAEIIGISESNVGTKINRIKNQLKSHFNTLKQ